MFSKDLQRGLIQWTVAYSGHEAQRHYIGLSGIGDCERVIYDRFRQGTRATVEDHLLCRLSYELEGRLVERLKEMGVYSVGEEIVLFDGLVQGHTDGVIGRQDLLEIKTLAQERWIPEGRKLPGRVFWQVQAYLHYTGRKYGHIVYLARDTGLIYTTGVSYSEGVGRKIEEKVGRLVEAAMAYSRPACTCGRCENNGHQNAAGLQLGGERSES
jgi:hypothetical protein